MSAKSLVSLVFPKEMYKAVFVRWRRLPIYEDFRVFGDLIFQELLLELEEKLQFY